VIGYKAPFVAVRVSERVDGSSWDQMFHVVCSTHAASEGFELTMLVVIGTEAK
jgi:hypothetical protein